MYIYRERERERDAKSKTLKKIERIFEYFPLLREHPTWQNTEISA